MTACSVFGCTNRSSRKMPGISFHRFPPDLKRRAQWVLALRETVNDKDWTPTPTSRVCSDHFTEGDYDRTSFFKPRLKDKVVPSIFEAFPPHLQKKKTSKKEPCFHNQYKVCAVSTHTSQDSENLPPANTANHSHIKSVLKQLLTKPERRKQSESKQQSDVQPLYRVQDIAHEALQDTEFSPPSQVVGSFVEQSVESDQNILKAPPFVVMVKKEPEEQDPAIAPSSSSHSESIVITPDIYPISIQNTDTASSKYCMKSSGTIDSDADSNALEQEISTFFKNIEQRILRLKSKSNKILVRDRIDFYRIDRILLDVEESEKISS